MTEPNAPRSRRRRRRAAGGDAPSLPADAGESQEASPRLPLEERSERSLRDLVGAGSSQLGVEGALRGRDVNRPSDQDIAEAEQTVRIVRRHWRPPA
jgi:hypothetical protein